MEMETTGEIPSDAPVMSLHHHPVSEDSFREVVEIPGKIANSGYWQFAQLQD